MQLEIDVIQGDDFKTVAIETLTHIAHSHYRIRHIVSILLNFDTISIA